MENQESSNERQPPTHKKREDEEDDEEEAEKKEEEWEEEEIHTSPPLQLPNRRLSKEQHRINKLGHYAINKFPLIIGSAINKTEDNNIIVFIMDDKANRL